MIAAHLLYGVYYHNYSPTTWRLPPLLDTRWRDTSTISVLWRSYSSEVFLPQITKDGHQTSLTLYYLWPETQSLFLPPCFCWRFHVHSRESAQGRASHCTRMCT